MATKKLTADDLRRMIKEEKAKLMKESELPTSLDKVKPREVEADEFASTLEKDLDFMQALKIKEEKAKNYLRKIQEAKAKARQRILKNL